MRKCETNRDHDAYNWRPGAAGVAHCSLTQTHPAAAMAAAERARCGAGVADVLGAAHSPAHADGEGGCDSGDALHRQWATAALHVYSPGCRRQSYFRMCLDCSLTKNRGTGCRGCALMRLVCLGCGNTLSMFADLLESVPNLHCQPAEECTHLTVSRWRCCSSLEGPCHWSQCGGSSCPLLR